MSSTEDAAQVALTIASAVSSALPPPWGEVGGTVVEVIGDLLPFFFPGVDDAVSLDQIIQALNQAFARQDIQTATTQIATTAGIFASSTEAGLSVKLPASVNDALSNDPSGVFATLYTFLQRAVTGLEEQPLLTPINAMATDSTGNICIGDGNLQAAYLPTFAYGVSVYLMLSSYWISLAVSTDGPAAVTDMSVGVPIENLGATAIYGSPGWIQYASAAVTNFSNLVNDRLNQVSPAIPGNFGIHQIAAVYFADAGEMPPGFDPTGLSGVFQYWNGGDTPVYDRVVDWPGNWSLSDLPSDSNAQFAVWNPANDDAQRASVQALRDNYVQLLQQTLYHNYFDPSSMQQTIQAWTTALAKLQYSTYALYLFYAGSGGDTNIGLARPLSGDVIDGSGWRTTFLEAGINTSTASSPVIFEFALYLFYKGLDPDTQVYLAQPGVDVSDGTGWSATALQSGINTTNAPAPVVFQNNLYLFYKGLGSTIFVGQAQGGAPENGAAWSFAELPGGINTQDAPAAIVFNGNLYVLYRGMENDIWIAFLSSWTDPAEVGNWSYCVLSGIANGTMAAPAPVVVGGELYVVYTGTDGVIYVATPGKNSVTDGNAWSATALQGISALYAPAPVVYDDTLYVFYTGSDSNLYVARQPAGSVSGMVWSVTELDNGIATKAAPSVVVL